MGQGDNGVETGYAICLVLVFIAPGTRLSVCLVSDWYCAGCVSKGCLCNAGHGKRCTVCMHKEPQPHKLHPASQLQTQGALRCALCVRHSSLRKLSARSTWRRARKAGSRSPPV